MLMKYKHKLKLKVFNVVRDVKEVIVVKGTKDAKDTRHRFLSHFIVFKIIGIIIMTPQFVLK